MLEYVQTPTRTAPQNLKELIDLAVRGLVKMFDPRSQLFCYRLVETQSGLVSEGLSRRYTIMSLLGLHQLEQVGGGTSPINVAAGLDRLVQDSSLIDNAGDLGLLLWLCALVAPESVAERFVSLGIPDALERFADAHEQRTMELSWLLAGLSHAKLASREKITGLTELGRKTYLLVKANQGSGGIFGHSHKGMSLSSRVRGRIGSFADQVYPIYALSKFGVAWQDGSALAMAQQCADTICRVQGDLGQWWWHYEAVSGRVIQRYPVYSVHQDGMAPMALFAVSDAGGREYAEHIYKGLAWIYGNNELQRELTDEASGMIWRNIHRTGKWSMYSREIAQFLGSRGPQSGSPSLRILKECRPYHFGWLLYAFAGRY